MDKRRHGGYNRSWLVLVQDCALSVVASLFAILMCRWLSDPTPGFTAIVLRWLGMSAVFSLISVAVSGSHKDIRRWTNAKTTGRLLLAVLIKDILLLLAILLGAVSVGSPSLNALLVLSDFLFTAFCLFYVRFVAVVFGKSESGEIREVVSRKNALVYGASKDSVMLADEITAKGEFNVVGFLVFDKSLSGRVIGNRHVYYCETPADFQALEWKLGGIDCIFKPNGNDDIDGGDFAEDDSQDMIQSAVSSLDVRTKVDHFVKRSFDVCLSGVLLIVFFPLAVIIAIAIYIEDGMPFLYKQERVGLYGEPFMILKFRSMRVDAEAFGAQLFSGDSDPRLTKVGRFIRAHHLDELPQIWNVFRGDMSFVGYRPERPFYISKIMRENPRYRYLYQIRPGVTSYATLYNGYTDTMEKMLKRLDLDLYYLRHHSVGFDMKVLGLTFLSIVSGKKF